MPFPAWNGAGTFTRTATQWQQDAANGILIVANRHDDNDQGIADGVNACLAKNGENTFVGSAGALRASTDNAIDVGSTAARWRSAYLGTSLVFKGASFSTTVTAAPTANRAVAMPDADGTLALVQLSKNTFAASASSIFTLDTTMFSGWTIRLVNVRPNTDGANLIGAMGTGGVFDAGANYNWGRSDVGSSGVGADSGAAATSSIQVAQSVGNGAGECVNGLIYVSNLLGSMRLQWDLSWVTAAGTFTRAMGAAEDTNGVARDQVRFVCSAGNFTSGSMTIYGWPT